MKNACSKFTIDVISSCAFGIESNSLKDPNAEFTFQLRKILEFDTYKATKSMIAIFAPKMLKVFRMNLFDTKTYDFIRETVWNTMDYR